MSNSPRSRFPWIPVIILAAAISGIFYVQSLPELERNLKSWMFAAIPLLTGILLLLWFLCSSRFTGLGESSDFEPVRPRSVAPADSLWNLPGWLYHWRY